MAWYNIWCLIMLAIIINLEGKNIIKAVVLSRNGANTINKVIYEFWLYGLNLLFFLGRCKFGNTCRYVHGYAELNQMSNYDGNYNQFGGQG